jgi:hypothetical protein
VRFGDASNIHGSGIYKNNCRKYPKENLNWKANLSDRRIKTQHRWKFGVEYVDWTHLV